MKIDQTVRMMMMTMVKMLIGINFTKQLLSLAQSVSCVFPFVSFIPFHSFPLCYFILIYVIFVILPLHCIYYCYYYLVLPFATV